MKSGYLVSDVISAMEGIAPMSIACEWDHVGLMVGDVSEPVEGVLLTLDAVSDSVQEAVNVGANLIISHHPLFFAPVREIDFQTSKGKIIRDLIKNDISLFAAHTNLDKAEKGVNQALAGVIGVSETEPVDSVEVGLVGVIKEGPKSLREFAEDVKEKLGATGFILNTDKDCRISRVFVQGGAFDEDAIPFLKNAGIDCIVTGEMKHHHMLELEELGIPAIVCGHEVTERIVLPSVKEQLLHKLPNLPVSIFYGHKW